MGRERGRGRGEDGKGERAGKEGKRKEEGRGKRSPCSDFTI